MMFKRRGLFLLLVSLVMGVAAAWTANNWVQTRLNASNDPDVDTVVAAALDIPYGMKIESRHVRLLELPLGTAPERAIREADTVIGMVSTGEVLRGEILMRDRFAEHEVGSTLAALVQKDMRAVTVRVNDVVGVAGFLLPGNRVDVLASRMNRSTQRAVTETVLKNIKVLAVDQTASTDKNEPVIVRAVTLEMSPPQTETLLKAKEEGRIQLTLRNPLDEDEDEDEEEIVVEEPQPAPRPVVRPAPRPAQPRETTITIIRGTAVDSTKSPG